MISQKVPKYAKTFPDQFGQEHTGVYPKVIGVRNHREGRDDGTF